MITDELDEVLTEQHAKASAAVALFDRIFLAMETHGCQPEPSPRSPLPSASGRCKVCSADYASVKVAVQTDGTVRLSCTRGCTDLAIARAIGLDDLAEQNSERRIEHLVREEMDKQRAREIARERLAAEKYAGTELPALTPLGSLLSEADDPVKYRIDGLLPIGGRVVFSAQHKSGKTTAVANAIRSLVDGDPFLERFNTVPVGRLVQVDNELHRSMLRSWLRDQDIVNTSKIDVLPLRGQLSSFNIMDDRIRSRWARMLGPADMIVIDCLRPMLDALGLSEDKDAGRFLEALDELTHEAGIGETLLVHHTGHGGDRSRGDSRILDWPDVVWNIKRDKQSDQDMMDADRYFSAYGRDVAVGESLLGYDPTSRRLHIAGGSRSNALAVEALTVIKGILARTPDMSQRQLVEAIKPHAYPRQAVYQAIQMGINNQEIGTRQGARNSTLHFLVTPSVPSVPRVSRGTGDECPSVPYRRDTHTDGQDRLSVPTTVSGEVA